MAERHAKKDEAVRCDVSGCKNIADRSVSAKKYQGALPSVTFNGEVGRRVQVCKDHYKPFRKATKEERELDRLGW
jgi:hypothetical protein